MNYNIGDIIKIDVCYTTNEKGLNVFAEIKKVNIDDCCSPFCKLLCNERKLEKKKQNL